MTIKNTIMLGSALGVVSLGFVFAQSQNPPGQNPSQSTETQGQTTADNPTAGQNKKAGRSGAEKPKRWTGNLVDAPCMDQALSGGTAQPTTPPPAAPVTPHFAQVGQSPSGQTPQRPGQPAQNPAIPESGQNPNNTDMSQTQAAQMAKATKIDNATKQCTASSSTQQFGLALSSGEVVKFDNDGNTKASEMMKEVSVQPGKKIKARVSGAFEENGTVKVASLEVKGKRNSSSPPASSASSPGR